MSVLVATREGCPQRLLNLHPLVNSAQRWRAIGDGKAIATRPGSPLTALNEPATTGKWNAGDTVRPRTQKTEGLHGERALWDGRGRKDGTPETFAGTAPMCPGVIRRRRQLLLLLRLLVDHHRHTTGRWWPGDNDTAARLTAMTGRGGVLRLKTRRAGRPFAHGQLQ